MRYDQGHRAESRKRITQSASQLFRRDGIGATAVAAVMSASDLTHGGFYWHFESKERLVCEALAEAQGARLRRIERRLSMADGGVEAVIRDYLSRCHVADVATGCTSAALAPEVARSSSEVRAAYTRGLLEHFEGISKALPPELQPRVPAVYAMLVGCVQLARACDDERVADDILASGLKAALSLFESGRQNRLRKISSRQRLPQPGVGHDVLPDVRPHDDQEQRLCQPQ